MNEYLEVILGIFIFIILFLLFSWAVNASGCISTKYSRHQDLIRELKELNATLKDLKDER